MGNILTKLFIRGTGIALATAGVFLIIETYKVVPSFVYVIAPMASLLGIVAGLICILYDGWK